MKIYTARAVIFISIFFLNQIACASTKSNICKKIIEIYASGSLEKHEIPYKLEPDGTIKHEINFKGDKTQYIAISECGTGSGSDAVCDIRILRKGKAIYNFSLPTHVGFIKIDNEIYLVNGIAMDRAGTVECNGFAVHKLFKDKLEEIFPNS